MALTNLVGWNKKTNTSASAPCGSACGSGDKITEQPAACGASDAKAPCGSACGAGDK